MMFSIPKLREIMQRKDKIVNAEELEMLKKWFEKSEMLMDFKNENDFAENKSEVNDFDDFHMDIYDVIKVNDPNFRN